MICRLLVLSAVLVPLRVDIFPSPVRWVAGWIFLGECADQACYNEIDGDKIKDSGKSVEAKNGNPQSYR